MLCLKRDIDINDNESKEILLRKVNGNIHKTHNVNQNCSICRYGYVSDEPGDPKRHNQVHFDHVMFCIENGYDFGYSISDLKDFTRWKLEELIREQNNNSLKKLELAIDYLKAQYWRDRNEHKHLISFEKYVSNLFDDDKNQRLDLLIDAGLLNILKLLFSRQQT